MNSLPPAARMHRGLSAGSSDAEGSGLARAGTVLVVDDNVLIGMEAEELLGELGYPHCELASTSRGAVELLDAHAFDFALLDIDLGGETSEPVAAALVDLGVPFAFTSGYPDGHEVQQRFPGAVIIPKPFSRDDLATALRTLKGQ